MAYTDLSSNDRYLLEIKKKMNVQIQVLRLPVEVEQILEKNKVYTVFQLLTMSFLDVYNLQGMGYERTAKVMNFVSSYLKTINFQGQNQNLIKRTCDARKKMREFSDTDKKEYILSMFIEELDLSCRTTSCLIRSRIYTVNELVKYSKAEIEVIRNMNHKCVDEIIKKLEDEGLFLKE